MNFYWFLYGFSIVFAIFIWQNIWSRYRNLSGFFFFLFTLFASIWNGLYFLFFFGINDSTILLYITRIAFATGIISAYNLLFFIIFFQNKSQNISIVKVTKTLLASFWVFVFFVFTPYIISGVEFSESEQVYREIYGKAYFLIPIAYVNFLILFFYIAHKKISEHIGLDRIRIRNIVIATYIALSFLIVLQVFFPLLGIWIFEKEIIFCFLFFIAFTFFTITRYYFSSIGYGITKFIIFSISFWFSVILLEIIEHSIHGIDIGSINNYWKIGESTQFVIKFFIGLVIYYLSYTFLRKRYLGVIWQMQLHETMQALQKEISTITDIETLRDKLSGSMNAIFKTSSCKIHLFSEGYESKQLEKFFSKSWNSIFVNDFVFLEEQKNYINQKNIHREVSKDDFLILPIHSTSGYIIGLFKLGSKPLGDFYTKIEIDEIQSFSFFLEIHLKYIRTYTAMEDLSMNLDKKVDEKTIEYNDLINRQKEFIGIISHEIRSPIGSAIFQSDSIIDDLESSAIDKEKIKEELTILNKQLVRTGWLISKLFSVQYYDTHTVNLFRENIEFGKFLEYEIELFSHVHSGISFQSKIDKNIWFIAIDKIQIQQVISNLLDNAIKFISDNADPVIIISAYNEWNNLHICIEDNGKWFEWIEIKDIFDKYSTWNRWTVWLGMGLYLCKKIISMHNGTIEAGISPSLHGAMFSIKIPTK